MVSSRQQVARIRRLAVRALDPYPLADPELRFIAHGENTAFRVDVTAAAVAIVSCSACTAWHGTARKWTRQLRSDPNWTG